MTPAITLWLAFVLAAAAIAWLGTRRQAVAFALVAILTLPATILPLGHAMPLEPPQGKYSVLGARIDIDVAIWVLLDDGKGGPPRYYKLPYSATAASDLQEAMDMVVGQEGGAVGMTMGEGGATGFAEETPAAEPPKRVETPILGGAS
ncbi:hypothetical protein CN090_04180 [Sinorhizobium meliloti]|uniref:hypothetical protein n=1 Tax=Rhizobium meliloti TaxID=382 RepID=UPI000FD711B7|nr:hypothetical protein [Sinorhizobium meliloti]RVO55124.1 hypothetical protein CN090_04180 [Sinorhizobium meliloti]